MLESRISLKLGTKKGRNIEFPEIYRDPKKWENLLIFA